MSAGLGAVLSYLRTSIVLWVGAIFCIAGSIGVFSGLQLWRDARLFEREAEDARATVVATSLERASRDGNPRTRYLATYRFATAAGETIEQIEEIRVEDWEQLEAGSTIDIRYVADEPGNARWRAADPAWVPPLVTGVTALFAVLGVLLALPGMQRMLLIWRVHRRGVVTKATVLEVAPSGTVVNRVPQWWLRYEYRDSYGRLQTGCSDLLDPGIAQRWRRDDQIEIRFDPERSNDSYWSARGPR